MILRHYLALALLLAVPIGAGTSHAGSRATVTTMVAHSAMTDGAMPAPAVRRHRVLRATAPARGAKRASSLARLSARPTDASLLAPFADVYMQDGTGPVVALNPQSPASLVVAFNEGWDFDPDIPLCSSGSAWSSVVFPPGTGIYAGYPHTPWSQPGNYVSELFVSMEREDLYPTDNTHTLLTRSTDAGITFAPFYEVPNNVRQDRAMFDIDRTAARGGTTGPHDGKLYLCFDDWGSGGAAYSGSYLDVLSPAGALLSETQLSGPGGAFRGNQFQPVAGVDDGRIYLVSTSLTNGGATVTATFHQIDGAGSGPIALSKSTLSWAPAGQKLGTTTHWGVNGHRIDERGFLDVDRSDGPHRGYLYFLSNRNPNPSDPTRDQGDLYLSVSFQFGGAWQPVRRIPTAGGQTQFFPMMDVDDQGWIHLAYYQNESGALDGGVLNASTVDLCYTVSRDGGVTWTPPVHVNSPQNALNLETPPLELGSVDYDLLGDYMQLQATGTGDNSSAYVGWTGYDQLRADDGVGTKKQRVYLTRVATPPTPAVSPLLLAALASGLVAAGVLGLRRRRGVSTG